MPMPPGLTNIDLSGGMRGTCSQRDCPCGGFVTREDGSGHPECPAGWCLICRHAPAEHGLLLDMGMRTYTSPTQDRESEVAVQISFQEELGCLGTSSYSAARTPAVQHPSGSLPLYFLQQGILAVDIELRFGRRIPAMVEEMKAILQIFADANSTQSATFFDLDAHLRPRGCCYQLISLYGEAVVPEPMVVNGRDKLVRCGGTPEQKICLRDMTTLEEALIVCLGIRSATRTSTDQGA